MELVLTNEEQILLSNILEQRHREILKEISHTDNREFRQNLRKTENMIENLLNHLRAATVDGIHA
jgi:hypothetical protein